MANPDQTAHLTEAERVTLAHARRLSLNIGVAIPAIVGLIGIALMVVWLPHVPSPMASHWGGSGVPDGFMNPIPNLLVAAATFGGVFVLMSAIIFLQARPRATAVWSSMHRFMSSFSLATMVFLMVTIVGTWQIQLDLTDATKAGGVGAILLIALGATVVSGLLSWVVQPRLRIDASRSGQATPLDITPGDHVAWVATVRPGTVFFVIIGLTLAIAMATTVWLYAIQEPSWWVSGLTMLVLFVLIAMTCVFHVNVTHRGFEAKSAIGWPVVRVTPEEIETVSAAPMNPLAEFGGIGLRWAPGRVGIVYRAGEGIIITKKDGKIVAVTVGDAHTGASLLARYSGPQSGAEA